MQKVLALIPARGGSVSIPRKNIKLFCGKPLIAWTIEAAKKSGAIDRIIVSTDDTEIARIAKEHGAEIPFMRPLELAGNSTPTLPVIQHAVSWLKENEGYYPDYVLLLEPTSPGRQAFHITEALALAERASADSVISLGAVPGHFNYHWQIELAGERAALADGTPWPDVVRRRQDLPTTYFRNGAFYLLKPDLLFTANPSMYGTNVCGYVVDEAYSFDIDSMEDWSDSEKRFAALTKGKEL